MKPWIIWVATIVGISAGSVCADEPRSSDADARLAAQVEQLVGRLADDNPRVRKDAEQQLISLGGAVLPLLPTPGPQTPEDLRLLLNRVRQQLEQADAELQTRATLVTLRGTMTLPEALNALQQQTGNRVLDYRHLGPGEPERREITVDIQQQPFWSAMDIILRELDLRLYAYSGQPNALAVISDPRTTSEKDDHQMFVIQEGLFRVELKRLALIQEWRDRTNDQLRLDLEVLWEPRVTPMEFKLPYRTVRALDDRGTELVPTNRDATRSSLVQERVCGVDLTLPFPRPPRAAQRLATVEATLHAVLPGKTAEFVFADLTSAKNEKQQRAGVTVTLQKAFANDQLTDVRIVVAYDTSGAQFESHRGWIFANPAYLQDAKGQVIDHVGLETLRQYGSRYGLSYKFEVTDLEGLSFVYRTPATFLSIPIPLRFQDVPLP